MKTERTIGILLILGVVGVFIPYTLLTFIFDYPDILRQETGLILLKFKEGGNRLIWTWWTFAMLGFPLVVAFTLLGQRFEPSFSYIRWATTIGVVGLLMQIIGLLRWTFVVPILAENFINGSELSKEASKVAFQVIHQYGGVILGEHLGQLFSIIWTLAITYAFAKIDIFPKWITWLGVISSSIYLMAQLELFATILPNVPSWGLAGFIGSTLWLIWLLSLGVYFLKAKHLSLP